jgi:hypothetical protein
MAWRPSLRSLSHSDTDAAHDWCPVRWSRRLPTSVAEERRGSEQPLQPSGTEVVPRFNSPRNELLPPRSRPARVSPKASVGLTGTTDSASTAPVAGFAQSECAAPFTFQAAAVAA